MAALWSGMISFGLVSIPVQLVAATSSHDLSLHQYHAADTGRVRNRAICELDGAPLEPDGIVKGLETEQGLVLLDEEDFDDLPVSTSKLIDVIGFVPAEQIDPIHYERSYYADPGRGAARPYVLLREALRNAGQAALVKVTLRQRESLAVLRPRGEVLVLHTMRWPDEIRQPPARGPESDVIGEAELSMAGALIEAKSMDFRPEEYTDAYQQALAEVVDAKRQGRAVPKPSPKEAPTSQITNLMEALQQSVDEAALPQRPAKKAAKKATARKRTTKKAAARKRVSRE